MRKIKILLYSLLISNTFFSQGLLLDKSVQDKLQKWETKEEFGYASTPLPNAISYRKYAPEVIDQGEISTCVGWAVSYAQLSTQQNIDMGITASTHKIFRAMDPNFIYSFVKDLNDKWCENGVRIYDAMEVLLKFGCKPMIWNPWLSCNSLETFSDFNLALAAKYKVKECYTLDVNDDLVQTVKSALKVKLPVSIGVALTESFMNGTTISSGLWKPKDTEKNVGFHAMCVIGYDDTKFGGAFEVMNSYGTNFGDNGFVWIKYSDFAKYVKEAYIIETTGMTTGKCSFGDCYNSYSRIIFDNGNIYEGVLKEGRPEGYGCYIYKNGNFYVGGFDVGRKNGPGLFYDGQLGKYYDVYFNKDVIVSKDEIQGFAGNKETINTKEIHNILQKVLPGKLISETDESFELFKQNVVVPENEIKVK